MTRNQIDYWNYVETARANRAREWENTRSNRAREIEDNRSHRATEELRARELNAKVSQLDLDRAETQRSNLAREFENTRSNLASEQIKMQSNVLQSVAQMEQSRSNMANEGIRREQNVNNMLQTQNQSRSISNQYVLGMLNSANSRRSISNAYSLGRESNRLQQERNRLTDRYNYINAELSRQRNEIDTAKVEQQNKALQETIRHNQVQEYLNAGSTALITGLKLGLGGRR